MPSLRGIISSNFIMDYKESASLPGRRSIVRMFQQVSSRDLLLAIGSGVLLTLSFPGSDLSFFAWVSLVPLFFALEKKSASATLVIGWVAGFVHYVSLLHWTTVAMHQYGKIPIVITAFLLVLLSLYLGLYLGVFGWAVGRFRSYAGFGCTVAAAPSLWILLEFVRSNLFSGFPWCLLGHSQYRNLVIIQVGDITGALGISFVIVLVNISLFLVMRWIFFQSKSDKHCTFRLPLLYTCVTMLVVAAVLLYGHSRTHTLRSLIEQSPHLQVALIQGNIDQNQKWSSSNFKSTLATYQALTRQATHEKTDLVVWPETAVPGYYVPELVRSRFIHDLADQAGSPMVFGSLAYQREREGITLYNSAFLISPHTEELRRYDKIHLVPFGEYVPLKPLLPFVDKLVEGIGEFSSGKDSLLLSASGINGGVLICYEVIFSQYARAYARKGATILINITNDAWFGRTGAPYQHLSMAVFRAVETRLPMVRAANTGVSAIISPIGKVNAETKIFEGTFLNGKVPVFHQKTLFVVYGDFGMVIIAFFISLVVFAIHVRRGKADPYS